jgi:alkyldihydroxyacetonephosphate synthase
VRRSVWWGWGDPAEAHPLPAAGWAALRDELGVPAEPPVPPVDLADVRLPSSALPAGARAALEDVVGAAFVTSERLDRVEHARGKSYPDLRRLRDGDAGTAPDAVVLPGSADEVGAVLRVCAEHDVAVVPFGGGTSVVGGVTPDRGTHRAVVSLDLRRLTGLVRVDTVSRTATFRAGTRGPDAEAALRPHGLTLGHYPQSHQQATIGGYVATRSAGQASTGYGRVDDLVLGARLETPTGTFEPGGRSPASAAGPGLLDLVVGSEGALGVVTEATLAVHPVPAATAHACVAFGSFADAVDALRGLVQDLGRGAVPEVCRLSDAEETRLQLTLAGRRGAALRRWLAARGAAEPCLLVLVWEGPSERAVRRRQRECLALLRSRGAHRLPASVARSWQAGRFAAPYLRDELMSRGVLVDTLETATTWDRLLPLHDRVRTALLRSLTGSGAPAIVQCHVSHVYPTGASLYLTFVTREEADPVAQWSRAKSAASEAISQGGGTITHHHAVGTDHLPWLEHEIGAVGARLLRAVRGELDPSGVMNPGTLVPAAVAAERV